MKPIPLLAAAALVLAIAPFGPAQAKEQRYTADLTGQSEVPSVDTAGTGRADIVLDTDTNVLSWTIEYLDLTGPPTAAHFHGPAAPSENAGPVVPIHVGPSPIEGSMPITLDQADDLAAGRWYINLHTAEHPDGEIRGQVVPTPQG